MDFASLIGIVIVIVIIYFFVKFIISPIIRVIFGILSFLVLIYLLQRLLGFNIDNILLQYNINLNINGWLSKLDWLLAPLDNLIEQIKSFLDSSWQKIPKS